MHNLICVNLLEEAWNDGTIRGFALNGGKLLFEINCAHTKSVSTITITKDDDKLISGGCDGQVYKLYTPLNFRIRMLVVVLCWSNVSILVY